MKQSDEDVLLDYSSHNKANKMYNKRTLCIQESVYVIFDKADYSDEKDLQDDDYDEIRHIQYYADRLDQGILKNITVQGETIHEPGSMKSKHGVQ